MAHIEGKAYMGVDGLLGLIEHYELLLCDHCASHQHADCTGKKSKLHTAGLEILGPCQCEDASHSSLNRKSKEKANVEDSQSK